MRYLIQLTFATKSEVQTVEQKRWIRLTGGVCVEASYAAGAIKTLSGFVGLGVLPPGAFLETRTAERGRCTHRQIIPTTHLSSVTRFLPKEYVEGEVNALAATRDSKKSFEVPSVPTLETVVG